MIKLPVKDSVTIPWISEQEIPAIKAALSAWRKARRSKQWRADFGDHIEALNAKELPEEAAWEAEFIARHLERLAAIDARMRKEKEEGK